MFTFFVPGIPKPGGSKRGFILPGTKRVIITDANPKSRDWKTSVSQVANDHGVTPLSGPLELSIDFIFPRPKGHFGTGKNEYVLKASAPQHHTVKPDATKLTRSTEDALTGIAWRDDAQVAVQTISKWYTQNLETPGARITIGQLEPSE
jgi:Holliday junction resolvase RusA-like endonuclease